MYVPFHGGDHNLAFGLSDDASARFFLAFFFLNKRDQVRHRLLHHPRRLHHLWEEHFALAEQITNDVHAVHQRPFDHLNRPAALVGNVLTGQFGVFGDEFGNAMHQGMG